MAMIWDGKKYFLGFLILVVGCVFIVYCLFVCFLLLHFVSFLGFVLYLKYERDFFLFRKKRATETRGVGWRALIRLSLSDFIL